MWPAAAPNRQRPDETGGTGCDADAGASTVSQNLALMHRCWVTVAETSPTGLAMSVTVTDIGVAPFTSASTAWRSAQTSAAAMLGPAAAGGLRVRVPVFQMGSG